MSTCNQCHNEREKLRRKARRSHRTQQGISEFADRMRRVANVQAANALVRQMALRFGGIDGFAAAWFAELTDRRSQANALKTRSYLAFFRMLEVVRQSHASLERLNDEETLEFMSERLVDLLCDHHALLAGMLATAGYDVTARDDGTPKDFLGEKSRKAR